MSALPIYRRRVKTITVTLKDGTTSRVVVDNRGRLIPLETWHKKQRQKKPREEPTGKTRGLSLKEALETMKRLAAGRSITTSPFTGTSRPGPTWVGGHGATEPPSGADRPLEERLLIEFRSKGLLGEYRQSVRQPLIPPDLAFRARLRSIITDNKFDRWLSGRTRGKVDLHHLTRVATGSRSVFRQKQSRKNKAYSVLILLDQSGSMHYQEKILNASGAVIQVALAFEGLVNLSLAGFNHAYDVHIPFGGKIEDQAHLRENMMLAARAIGAGCNHDYEAILRSYLDLEQQTGEKILILLSDGQPATDCDEPALWAPPTGLTPRQRDETVHFHHLINAWAPRVKTVGIGISSACEQVPGAIPFVTPESLKPALLKTLSGLIRRG